MVRVDDWEAEGTFKVLQVVAFEGKGCGARLLAREGHLGCGPDTLEVACFYISVFDLLAEND
jgi:hypothetical protein